MKKVYLLFLIFIVFSCKNTPKKEDAADDPGLSQLELTKEEAQTTESAGFSDEPSADAFVDGSSSDNSTAGVSPDVEDALAQDGITEGSAVSENSETKTDDLQADAQNIEKQTTAEAVVEKKETPEVKNPPVKEEPRPAPTPVQPSSPAVAREEPRPAPAPVQPPPAAAKEEPPAAETPAVEKPAEEQQEAQSESETPQPPPPRYQPWITPPPSVTALKDDAPVPNRQTLVPPKEDNVFSRIVRVTVGQLLDIPFRGTNWSYLEDIASRRGIVYNSRRVDSEGMIFTFRAEAEGIYALRFYRRDYIRDNIFYDYVQVIVEESPNKVNAGAVNPSIDRGKVTAEPRWPSAFEEAEMLRGSARPSAAAAAETVPSQPQRTTPQVSSANRDSAQAQGTGAAPQVVAPAATPLATTPQAVTPSTMPQAAAPETPVEKKEKLPPEEILKKAQDAFNGGDTAAAIALLDQYTEYYPGGNDELYWLYGQFYEANTPSRNILFSIDYYRRLVNEYPQSRRYNDARRRISYLERFYINIQ